MPLSKHISGLSNQGKHSLRLATSALMVLALLTACGKKDSESAGGWEGGAGGAMPPMPVTAIEVQQQRVPIIIEAIAQAEGSKEVEVRARVTGILMKQRYTEGDKVKEGTVLFNIDRAPYEIALAQARAALMQDQANVEQAKREQNRLKPLVEQRAVSSKELDDAVTTLAAAEAAVMASEARLREAQLNISYTDVTAPITGVTGRALRSEGSLITAGTDASLLTTMSINDPLWVRFSFSESETLQLRKNNGKTEVKLVLPDGSTYDKTGKINFAASSIDTRTGTVELRAEFPNPKTLLMPGQFVRVQAVVGNRDAFLIPQSAVSQTDQGTVAFTVSPENTVVPKPVETAGASGNSWIVTGGLAPGDKVIVDNLLKLRPGAPVAPHAPGQGPGAGGPPGAGGGGNWSGSKDGKQEGKGEAPTSSGDAAKPGSGQQPAQQ